MRTLNPVWRNLFQERLKNKENCYFICCLLYILCTREILKSQYKIKSVTCWVTLKTRLNDTEQSWLFLNGFFCIEKTKTRKWVYATDNSPILNVCKKREQNMGVLYSEQQKDGKNINKEHQKYILQKLMDKKDNNL